MRRSRRAGTVDGAAVLAFAAVFASAALGGCRGAQPPSSVAAGRPAAPSRTPAAEPRTAPLPPARPCGTAELSVAPVSRITRQGLDIERFALRTTAADGCTLTGPPNLRPKGPLSPQVPGATADLAVSQLPVPDGVDLQAGDGGTIRLSPGGTASFYLAWYSASPIVCVQSDGFGFNAPGDTSYSDMKAVDYAVGPVCDGIFYVSPVF